MHDADGQQGNPRRTTRSIRSQLSTIPPPGVARLQESTNSTPRAQIRTDVTYLNRNRNLRIPNTFFFFRLTVVSECGVKMMVEDYYCSIYSWKGVNGSSTTENFRKRRANKLRCITTWRIRRGILENEQVVREKPYRDSREL
jgi:hypothetical protein